MGGGTLQIGGNDNIDVTRSLTSSGGGTLQIGGNDNIRSLCTRGTLRIGGNYNTSNYQKSMVLGGGTLRIGGNDNYKFIRKIDEGGGGKITTATIRETHTMNKKQPEWYILTTHFYDGA